MTDDLALQPVIFTLFLSMYLVTVLGNLLKILTVSSYSHLHTPIYFLLSNLSFTDMCFSTTAIPKMLVNIQRQSKTISYTGCLRQIGFVLIFTALESSLLAVMAYDHYVAICCPLMYLVIMNPHFCVLLILLSFSISIVDGLLHSLMMKETVFHREFPVRTPAACVTSMFQMIIVKLEIQEENIMFTEMPSHSYLVSIIGGLENRLLAMMVCAVDALLYTLVVLKLSCTDLEIPCCLCELAQMIKLTCSDTLVNDIVVHSPLPATWEIVLSLRSFSQNLELSAHF
ncbi:olfactory receptor 7G3-like [Sciurus carolinensis]|uniref:olfactory receptor 7G3-like n=1 Tax=Sciurus carolinensis TaxID=30640 RepID=UPI001FB34766|nr:olfactory receptor 7G3-like [Sciurus carolinensis]